MKVRISLPNYDDRGSYRTETFTCTTWDILQGGVLALYDGRRVTHLFHYWHTLVNLEEY